MNKPNVESFQAYVSDCYEQDAPPYLVYHNIVHTEKVVAHCQELATHYRIQEKDQNLLLIAAWFHDIGHLYTMPQDHEEKSAEIMHSFLDRDLPTEDILTLEKIILATKTSVKPQSLLEYIIRDADIYHFGTDEFFTTDALVRRETELRTGLNFPFWNHHSMELLKAHRFWTSYCQKHLNAGKQKNICSLEAHL